jgi:hypothetical protein
MEFETTRLWKEALAPVPEDTDGGRARERLRAAFLSFRKQVEMLVGEIHRDLPEFTVHDITHLDALWGMADLVAGPALHLTPPEAFVLGGAILLHDAGMALAAYPGGLKALERTQRWQDTIAALLYQKLDRPPSAEEIRHVPENITAEATREVLRACHAEQASRLPQEQWTNASGTRYHLIEDVELRKTYGELIGRIAQSHHWPVSRLGNEFTELIGAPPWCHNSSWTVDPLKLACLLRIADAGHLDARRAPGFLRALRRPKGLSDAHWAFQERLQTPRVEAERLVYSSPSRFPLDEAPAWWLCLDTLRMVDRELQQVDSLLADLKRPRLAAHGVAGVEDPARLKRLIPTEGWSPVDTRVKVSDIPSLLKRFGGEQLYGKDPLVPLRELLQNATDAVRARRLQEDRPEDWGDVIIRMGEDEHGHWVELEDTGLGMSAEVLTGPLLDFGTSYWSSPLAREQCPGLVAKGFRPTGKYGIGFFSVFMWGDRVRVVSRRAEEARNDTRVLEFDAGLESRPILRPARREEWMLDGGTRVRVWLKTPPEEPEGLLYGEKMEGTRDEKLGELLAFLGPCLDANLYVEDSERKRGRVLTASDWISMDGSRLFRRLEAGATRPGEMSPEKALMMLGRNLEVIKDSNGEIVGRACINILSSHHHRSHSLGVIINGGLRIDELRNIAGILKGTPRSAARDSALPIIQREELAEWATRQGKRWLQESLSEESLNKIAQVISQCGGDIGELPVALRDGQWLSQSDIARQSWPSEVFLVDLEFLWAEDANEEEVKSYSPTEILDSGYLDDDALIMDRSIEEDPLWGSTRSIWPTRWEQREGTIPFSKTSLAWPIMEALARAWAVDPKDIIANLEYARYTNHNLTMGGSYLDTKFRATHVVIIRKPTV